MFIQQLSIDNFRGIRSLRWTINDRIIPLVGKGDSCKSTIIEAMELLFNGSDRLLPTDDYFHVGSGSEGPVAIEAVITELPMELESNDKYLGCIRGYDPQHQSVGELIDGRSPCVILRLSISKDTLPKWELLDEDNYARRNLSEHDRRKLPYISLLSEPNTHLTWNDRSVLRKSLDDRRDIDLFAVASLRNASLRGDDSLTGKIVQAMESIQGQITGSGAYIHDGISVGLMPGHSIRGGSWHLLDETGVSLTSYGQGSRRLMSFGLQDSLVGSESVVAIDEIETGLEPHRLSRLLQTLENRIAAGKGQVFMTTHSQRVIEHFGQFVQIVQRRHDSVITVKSVPNEINRKRNGIHGTVRQHAAALLAERVLVLEGATEVGLVRKLLQKWDLSESPNSSSLGIEFVDAGGGDKILPRAEAFRSLGLDVIVVIDNDTASSAQTIVRLKELGVVVCCTTQGNSIEQDIFTHLGREEIQSVLLSASQLLGKDVVLGRLRACLGPEFTNFEDLYEHTYSNFDVLLGIAVSGRSSSTFNIPKQDGGLFKTQDGGAILANAVIASSARVEIVNDLRHAVYGDNLNE